MSSIVLTNSPPASQTAHSSAAPSKMTFFWGTGESASASSLNRVLIPNAQTRKVLADTEASVNVVNHASLDELFSNLDS